MSSKRIDYRTLKWSTGFGENFDGQNQEALQGPGRLNFDNLEPVNCDKGTLLFPRFAFSYAVQPEGASADLVDLYLRPLGTPSNVAANDSIRRVLFSGAGVYNFKSDCCCLGHPVPFVDGNTRPRFELIFQTQGAPGPADVIIDFWWERAPRVP